MAVVELTFIGNLRVGNRVVSVRAMSDRDLVRTYRALRLVQQKLGIDPSIFEAFKLEAFDRFLGVL